MSISRTAREKTKKIKFQYNLIKSPYSRKKIADGLNDQNRTNKNVFVISGFFKKKPLCLFLSAVIILQLGSSLSPSTMTGGTCHQLGAVAPWRSVLLFLLCFQPKQQTALAAFFSVSLLGFEKPCFFEVTDPAADGGCRELEVCSYSRYGRPALVVLICPVGEIDIHRHGSVRQFGAVKKIKTARCFAPPFRLNLL